MHFDIFFSICQTPVNGYKPSERQMYKNFFEQVRLADDLGFGCAWIAETHLSCQVQKGNPEAVIPEFEGEIGLNTDFLQLAHRVFASTKQIHVGSAIRNILCNGGPMAHAEAIKMFLALHGLEDRENRLLEVGFAAGRFPFSNIPYGIRPRNDLERKAWPALKGLIFQEATEIFLRFLRGDIFSSQDVQPKLLRSKNFRSDQEWQEVLQLYRATGSDLIEDSIPIAPFWTFDEVGVIPFESRMELARFTIGAHDVAAQTHANQFMPVGVFNLSITPSDEIEKTHQRMQKAFHPKGGAWTRAKMPRTALVFLGREAKIQEQAEQAIKTYWRAMEGTIDQVKIQRAVNNALIGNAEQVAGQIRERFNPEDRLMLWFDFFNHDSRAVQASMQEFFEEVVPRL